MNESVLLGRGHEITEMPRATWEGHLAGAPEKCKERFHFMSEDHHRVRDFVVEELARRGVPLLPASIADSLELPAPRVATILDELEANLFFLVRDDAGAVSWAFPVPADETPHRLVFSTGERLHGA